jgi:hypothetical protein
VTLMETQTLQINNMFLIGAGFTKAVFQNAPLNANLMHLVIQDDPQTLLRTYKVRYHTDDIEILLTRMDLETEELQSEQLRRDREFIKHDLTKYFERFRFCAQILGNNKWLENFAKKVLRPNDAIITTNYDCFLEGLLDHYKIWQPTEGYINAHDPSQRPNFHRAQGSPKGIKFYKIHGSEHFRECKVFNENGETEKTIIGFIINESIYPVSGENSNLGWAEEYCKEYIIAPSFVKIPHFQIADMVNKAKDAARTVQNMAIIGSSLRNEDIFLRLIVTGFVTHVLQKKRKLIIVDPNADSISKKIENFWTDGTQNITFQQIPKNIEDGLDDLTNLLEDI